MMCCARMGQDIFGGDCSRIARIRTARTSVGLAILSGFQIQLPKVGFPKYLEFLCAMLYVFGTKICLQSCASSVCP